MKWITKPKEWDLGAKHGTDWAPDTIVNSTEIQVTCGHIQEDAPPTQGCGNQFLLEPDDIFKHTIYEGAFPRPPFTCTSVHTA